MKMKLLACMLLFILFVSSSCTRRIVIVKTNPAHRIPPGQAKKMTGSQSAKPYAPGQVKKRG